MSNHVKNENDEGTDKRHKMQYRKFETDQYGPNQKPVMIGGVPEESTSLIRGKKDGAVFKSYWLISVKQIFYNGQLTRDGFMPV